MFRGSVQPSISARFPAQRSGTAKFDKTVGILTLTSHDIPEQVDDCVLLECDNMRVKTHSAEGSLRVRAVPRASAPVDKAGNCSFTALAPQAKEYPGSQVVLSYARSHCCGRLWTAKRAVPVQVEVQRIAVHV
jgi:hypothetical protein